MKTIEKALLGFTLLTLIAGGICFACNQDIYREVGNAHPANGYAEFVTRLSDEEFVLQRYEGWENSNSWVLRGLYEYLTTKGATLNAASIVLTQATIAFVFYYSFACIPLVFITAVRMYQQRKKSDANPTSASDGRL